MSPAPPSSIGSASRVQSTIVICSAFVHKPDSNGLWCQSTLVISLFKCLKGQQSHSLEYPQDCLPQDCLLVGNPEVGNSEYIIHQDCLP